jgi:(2R)-sulfolactate sulfo-lyase subunit alpha
MRAQKRAGRARWWGNGRSWWVMGEGERAVEGDAGGTTGPEFLVHNEGDEVAVAVADVGPGVARVRYLDSGRQTRIEVVEPIPLGHKVALRDLAAGAGVREYGVQVALTRAPIPSGSLAHVHNLRSARWETSR